MTQGTDTEAGLPTCETEPIALLNRAGLVITASRLAVLQVLRQAPPDGYMTLNDIHAGLHACNARLSLIGVYQTLHRLAQAGVLERQAYGPVKQGARAKHAFRLRLP
ncbi:MAG TPA: transcriptional repressor [Burkholderiaceae bacterium]